MKFRHLLILCLIPALTQLYGQESKEDLSKQAANPIAELISLPFQNNLNGDYGEYNRNVNVLNIQPVIPLFKGKLITRTIFPIVRIPDFTSESGKYSSGLSDIVATAFFVPESKNVIWGFGPVLELPTGGSKRGTQKWSIGPSFLALIQPGDWTFGVLINTGFFSSGKNPSSPLTEWSLYKGQDRIPEAMAPKSANGRSTLALADAETGKDAEGVLFVLGGISSWFTVYMDHGLLKAEYNAMTMNRYKIASRSAIPTGRIKIEVETLYDSNERMAPATVTLKKEGKQVGQGRIERSVPSAHTVSETFDVGVDLGLPVALDYYDRAPFRFNGKINKIDIKYMD